MGRPATEAIPDSPLVSPVAAQDWTGLVTARTDASPRGVFSFFSAIVLLRVLRPSHKGGGPSLHQSSFWAELDLD